MANETELWRFPRRLQRQLHAEYPVDRARRLLPPHNKHRTKWKIVRVSGAEFLQGLWLNNKALNWPVENPGVYVWHRGDECRYIGQTVFTFAYRLRDPRHPINVYGVESRDVITFLECGVMRLDRLERRLIRWFRPTLNRRRYGAS